MAICGSVAPDYEPLPGITRVISTTQTDGDIPDTVQEAVRRLFRAAASLQ